MTYRACVFLSCLAVIVSSTASMMAAERDAEAAAAAASGQSEDEVLPRPAKLVDLTKGEPLPPPPPKSGYALWHMGPVGPIGVMNGLSYGDQIQITAVTKGSPADGKILPGDVIVGLQDKKLRHDRDLDRQTGDVIIKAEEEAGKGILKLNIWRDRNWSKRTGPKDLFEADVDQMIAEAENDSDVYEWKEEEEKTAAVTQMAYDKFPVDGFFTNITVQLEVMGTYSDDSPWNCPVVKKVRENAWKLIAEKLKPDVRGRSKRGGNWPDVLALVASGEPEYVDIAKAWVHRLSTKGRNGICQDMNHKGSVYDVTYGGMQSWHHGFNYLEMAIYYHATGDKFILPEVRKRAICAALGQNGGGSWGHTFAFPHFNGGMLHRNNPGYGAMNNAGTRCFFLLTLAQKAGIKHPEIDAAIARSTRYFRTFIDKGCIGYGYHSPYPSDDSNGKNFGAAYAFYVLGMKYEAKYFGLHSAHASFTRRGGHGSPTLWYYTPWSGMLAGPEAHKATMRNMRYFYTLSRRYDGSFIFYGRQAGIGGKGMRNPTATVAMHYSYPLKQLIITGKDADPNFWATDEELEELLISARDGQVKDPVLLARIGKPWKERSTDEIIDLLDHFKPKVRGFFARELGKRYKEGEKDILPKVVTRLKDSEDRMRDGACKTLSACGRDEVLANMSTVVSMLKDEAEFVRMQAARTIGGATELGDKTREVELLKCIVDDHPKMTADMGNVKTAVKGVLLRGKKRGSEGPDTLMTTSPFQAGYSEELVRRAMERIVTMDPQGAVPGGWDREALLKLAGPVTFSAEVLQVNDAMFGGARKSQAQALLRKHGYREAAEGDAYNLRQRSLLPRHRRRGVKYKDGFITPALVKQAPGRYRGLLDAMRQWQHDNPTLVLSESTGKGRPPITTPIHLLIAIVERDTDNEPLPSVGPDVAKMFLSELAAAGGTDAQVKLCRKELEDLERKNYWRKIHAMTYLVKKLGARSLDDISPLLGHEHWRLREHANKVAVMLVKAGAGEQLIENFEAALERESGLLGNWNAAGIIAALADAKHKPALAAAKAALKHHDKIVREAAIQAVFKIGGDAELGTVMAFMRGQAEEYEDFNGCELALLSRRDDPKHVQRVSAEAISLLPKGKPMVRRSLAWLLCQYGGEKSLAAVHEAAATTTDDADLKEMVLALAYSPDRVASKLMLDLVNSGKRIRDVVAPLSVHRMVGRNGFDEVSDKDRVTFARGILNLTYNGRLVQCLGRTHTGPSMQLLFDVMKMQPELAAKSIIECAEGMRKPTKLDSQIAAEVLADVVEYIEVTHLRGGIKAHVKSHLDAGPYMMWRDYQMRAGQALLKFHKPKQGALETFDEVDLDI